MSGTANAGETTVDGGVKAEWMKSDYKFIFRTSDYPGEMEGMRKACAILLNARSEVNIMPVKESTREIIEVSANIPKDLDGWQHYWYNRRVVQQRCDIKKKRVDFYEVHLQIRSSWKLSSMLANKQIRYALEKAGVKIFATKFVGNKPRSFIGSFIGPIPTMSNRTEIEKALESAFQEDGTMVEPEFELIRKKETVFDKGKKEMFVSEVWGINVQKEYTKEAFAATQKLLHSDRPPLGLRNAKFVATPTETTQVKMIRCTEQNTHHYQTAVVVCDHVYPADITFTEGLEEYFDFLDSSESDTIINMRTLIDENIGRFLNDNMQSDEVIKDIYFNRGKLNIACTKSSTKEVMSAFQKLVTDLHHRVSSKVFYQIFGIHSNLSSWKFPYVEALDTVGQDQVIRTTLSFACPDDIDKAVFDEFISERGYSQEIAAVPEKMNRCPKFTYTNKRQVVAVEIDPKCKSENFWAAKHKERVPGKVTATKSTTTTVSSVTAKSETTKIEKKFKEELNKRDAKHKEELRKMQTNFELQMNKMKSDFETANATLNNKIVLIQNDVSSMNTKLDTGFNNNQSLISELSQQFQNFATAFVSAKTPSPERTRKKRQQTINETLDTTNEDDLSSLDDPTPPNHDGYFHGTWSWGRMLGLHRSQGRGGAHRLSSTQPFTSSLPLQKYFKKHQITFDSEFKTVHGISSDRSAKRYETFLKSNLTDIQAQLQKLHPWQKGQLGNFMGLSEDPSKSDTFRIRLHNRNGFNTKFLLQDFETFIVSELAAESSFTGITEVNVTASKTIPFHDICKKLDYSSKLHQTFPMGKPTIKDSNYHKGGQLCFLPSYTAGRKHSLERDRHGRWTITRLNSKDQVITIITAYRVCSNSFDLSENTIVAREVRSLLNAKHPQWDKPRDAFLQDLRNLVDSERKANRAVFIGGDFNSNILDEDIQQFMDACGLYNLLEGDDMDVGTSCTRSAENSGLIDLAMGTVEFAVALLSAGARGFFNDSKSDHRLIELSFSKESLFKTSTNEERRNRHFNIKNRKQRELYLKTLRDLHEASNTADALQSCKDAFDGKGSMSREDAIQKMKNIEKRSTEYMRIANSVAAPPVSFFRYHHSDTLSNAGKALRDANHLLQSNPDSPELKDAKATAVKNLMEVKQHSNKYREAMATGQSLDAMDKYKCKEESAIRQIVNHEKILKQHASVKLTLATARRGALDRIVVPQPTETTEKDPDKITWCPVTDPKDIEDVLFRQNHRHLLQSSISVFARGPISDLLGEDCSNTDDILNGNIDIAEVAKAYGHLEESTNLLLKEMQCRRDERGEAVVMDWKFEREEFRAAFSRSRNNTAPGFSGLPMTYWKAICEDDALCDIYAYLLETAFKQGFTYDRWLKSIQAMLQKKDLPYYMKLRIIELFELDYNAVLKFLFGKVFARYEQAAGFQNSESYGAVQGRSAHQALNSALIVYEHSRVTASPMAASPQDATGCFDLIRPEQTGIIQQAKGLNKEATSCNMQVLHGMERHIRTAAGITERSLKFDKKRRNYGGIGQGSGNGPQHGNDTNGLNKDILARETQSYVFTHPNGGSTISRDGNAFIDDIIHFVLLASNCFIAAVPMVTRKLQLWQNLLNASGGDLAIDKCVILFLLYKTIVDKTGKSTVVLKATDEEPGDISLQPFNQEAARINIRRIEPSEGERYLGVRAAGDGNWRDEYKHRAKQMQSMASKVHTCTLDRNEAHLLYSTRYKPTISYPLHHTTFTDNECDKLQSPILRAILPKMGYNRNFPRAVVHGPHALGGNQIIDLKVEQFVLQLVDVMTAVRKMDIIGEQIVHLIAAHQRFLGSATQFFALPPSDFEYRLQNSRIMYLWEKVHKYGVEIKSMHFWVPISSKANDTAIMDAFILLRKRRRNTSQRITSTELHNANEVRLFLRCTFLSDIVGEDGKIRKSAYEADRRCDTRESYPNRKRPNKSAIDAWKKCLQGAFITGDRDALPSLLPIDRPTTSSETDSEPTTVKEYLSRQPQHIRDILGDENMDWNEDDIQCIRLCLEQDQDVEIFGDGTVKNGKGAHYYAIKPAICENPKYLGLHGGAKTSSNSSGLVSLRPESFSIVAALNIIKATAEVYDIRSSDSRLIFRYDNTESLRRLSLSHSFPASAGADATDRDSWEMMAMARKAIPFDVTTAHVKSHQDDKIPYDLLPYEAQMNVEMDRRADAIRDGTSRIPPVPEFEGQDFQIKIDGVILYSDVGATLRKSITGKAMQSYLKTKYEWSDNMFSKIDWDSLEAYLKGLSQQVRTNVLKLRYGWQYTRERSNIFEMSKKEDFELEDDSCPLGCGDIDNKHHFLHCPCQPGYSKSNTELRRLDRFLLRYKTPQPLCHMILLGLRSVLCNGNPTVFCGETEQEEAAFEAYCDQEEIGWHHFLLGNLSSKWKQAMESHYAQMAAASDDKLPQHLSAKVWTKKLLCHVLHISLNRWQIRNEFHHAMKEDSDYRAERENLLDKIEAIFAKRHPSIQAFRTLFTHTYHSLASLPNSGIRNWLKSYGLVCKFVGPSLITTHFSQ